MLRLKEVWNGFVRRGRYLNGSIHNNESFSVSCHKMSSHTKKNSPHYHIVRPLKMNSIMKLNNEYFKDKQNKMKQNENDHRARI